MTVIAQNRHRCPENENFCGRTHVATSAKVGLEWRFIFEKIDICGGPGRFENPDTCGSQKKNMSIFWTFYRHLRPGRFRHYVAISLFFAKFFKLNFFAFGWGVSWIREISPRRFHHRKLDLLRYTGQGAIIKNGPGLSEIQRPRNGDKTGHM